MLVQREVYNSMRRANCWNSQWHSGCREELFSTHIYSSVLELAKMYIHIGCSALTAKPRDCQMVPLSYRFKMGYFRKEVSFSLQICILVGKTSKRQLLTIETRRGSVSWVNLIFSVDVVVDDGTGRTHFGYSLLLLLYFSFAPDLIALGFWIQFSWHKCYTTMEQQFHTVA